MSLPDLTSLSDRRHSLAWEPRPLFQTKYRRGPTPRIRRDCLRRYPSVTRTAITGYFLLEAPCAARRGLKPSGDLQLGLELPDPLPGLSYLYSLDGHRPGLSP